VHIYFKCMQLEKSCGIAQLVVGYVTICSAERTRVFFGIAWLGMDGRERYNGSPDEKRKSRSVGRHHHHSQG
jgi:hypothetical protein